MRKGRKGITPQRRNKGSRHSNDVLAMSLALWHQNSLRQFCASPGLLIDKDLQTARETTCRERRTLFNLVSLYFRPLATHPFIVLKDSCMVGFFKLLKFPLDNNVYLILEPITYFAKKGDSIQ